MVFGEGVAIDYVIYVRPPERGDPRVGGGGQLRLNNQTVPTRARLMVGAELTCVHATTKQNTLLTNQFLYSHTLVKVNKVYLDDTDDRYTLAGLWYFRPVSYKACSKILKSMK